MEGWGSNRIGLSRYSQISIDNITCNRERITVRTGFLVRAAPLPNLDAHWVFCRFASNQRVNVAMNGGQSGIQPALSKDTSILVHFDRSIWMNGRNNLARLLELSAQKAIALPLHLANIHALLGLSGTNTPVILYPKGATKSRLTRSLRLVATKEQ